MISLRPTQEGFTAVELLITLFIAATFLFAGYQLYIQVTRDGKIAGTTAKISNLAYEKMRSNVTTVSADYPGGCVSASQSTTTSTQEVPGVGNVSFVTTISCPYGTATAADLFLVRVKATYTLYNEQKELEHATYAN